MAGELELWKLTRDTWSILFIFIRKVDVEDVVKEENDVDDV